MVKTLTPEKLYTLLYEQKKTVKQASLELGVHPSTLNRLLSRYRTLGLIPVERKSSSLEDRLPIEKLRDLWGRAPTKEIAYQYGVEPETLYRLVADYRKQRPEWFPKPKTLTVHDLEGKTVAQIRRETGRSETYIKRRKKELGFVKKTLSEYLDRDSLQALLHEEGFSVSKIAQEYEVTYRAVYRLVQKYGLTVPKLPRPVYPRFTDEEKQYIADAKAEGQSIVRVAQTLGRTAKSIEKQFGVLEKRRKYVKVQIPEKELEEEYVIFGKSPEQIAEERGLSVLDVTTNIKRYGMKQ